MKLCAGAIIGQQQCDCVDNDLDCALTIDRLDL